MGRAWDVVVVGAGPAGCFVAETVQAAGRRVLLLDAGPRLPPGQTAPEVDRRAWGFKSTRGSFDWYRVRAVGGRSLLWGGWCYRFPDYVLRRGGWPVSARTLAPFYRRAEERLALVEGPLEARSLRAARALGVRVLPKRAPLVGHRIWTARDSAAGGSARPDVIALRFEHERGSARALVCLDLRTGREVRVRARSFVLAASPIETTRVLIESEVGPANAYGRGLVDHMVASYLLIEPRPPPARAESPLAGSALFDPRVNADEASRRPYRGGFTIEVSGPGPLESLGVERMVPSDEVDRHSATMLHAIGEVFPSRGRYVDLDSEDRDAFGRRTPRIHFAWTREDGRRAADMMRACVALADELAMPGSRFIPFVDPMNAGAGHEAGTCARDELVDSCGKLRALANVWIADASVMPTAGDRHPTLTLLAQALRVGDDVARSCDGGSRSSSGVAIRGH